MVISRGYLKLAAVPVPFAKVPVPEPASVVTSPVDITILRTL